MHKMCQIPHLLDLANLTTDYPCAKFGDFSFSRFGFIVQTGFIVLCDDETDQRYTHATTVGVSNYIYNPHQHLQHCI